MDQYALIPVGYVRNDIRSPEEVPYNGAPSVLELLPEHAEAARGLEPGYVWVLTWLHRSERRSSREGAGGRRGSFASRTPARLNPVAVTAARLLRIEEGRLHVDALDVCDRTPLLDVKPYVREFDCIFGPADPAWRRAALPEQRLARLARTIERFCGPLPELALGARLALAADRDLDVPANSRELAWDCRCAPGIAAAIQAVCGAPLGTPRFSLGSDEGTVAVRHGQRATRYRLVACGRDAREVLEAPEDRLFTHGD
ncbi:MAG TPA: TrmO family methyltransferase [Armatimonadota bacterium]|nr:TrmO family methyltransferase [Armatimonadota bacterium]